MQIRFGVFAPEIPHQYNKNVVVVVVVVVYLHDVGRVGKACLPKWYKIVLLEYRLNKIRK